MIRIVTDSTSELTQEQARKWNIDVVPLSVLFGKEEFLDGVEISHAQFYDRLAQVDTLPTTAQVPPDTFIELFRHYIEAGDQIVGLFLSSDMSGTFQSACIARSAVDEDNIFVLDTRTVTFGLGLMVREAIRMRDAGLSAADMASQLEELSGRVHLLAAVSTLKYLKMGGRISAATAVVGGMLGISPIIAVQDGVVVSLGKSRGRKGAFQWIARRILEQEPIDTGHLVVFGHSNAPDALAECQDACAQLVDVANAPTSPIGAVVGTHAGPGAAGIAYFLKKQ